MIKIQGKFFGVLTLNLFNEQFLLVALFQKTTFICRTTNFKLFSCDDIYLVCPDRLLIGLLSVSEVVADVDERQRDPEPHGPHRQHRRKRDGPARVLSPDEKVDENSEGKDDAGVEGCGEEGGPLPLFSLQGFVETSGVVSADESQELVEEDRGRQEGAPRGRRKHSEHGEEDGDGHHGKDLKCQQKFFVNNFGLGHYEFNSVLLRDIFYSYDNWNVTVIKLIIFVFS